VTLAGGTHVTLLVETPRGYANLCRLLTAAYAGDRLQPALELDLLIERNEGLVCLSGCARQGLAVHDPNTAARVAQAFGRERFFVELQRPFERGDSRRNARLRELAESLRVETVAATTSASCSPRTRRPSASRTTRPQSPGPPSSPTGSVST
jgi:error-prone DNA polymerase